MAEPLTREEKYLNAIANSQNINLKPITREEIFLAKASGQDITTPTPITRREMFLSKISSGSKPEQEKKVEITKNGATEIFPDEGYVLSKVTANVNVPTASGENKLAQLVDKSITEVTAEDLAGVITIGEYAFYNCRKLMSVTIPDNVTKTGSSTFSGCVKIVEVINKSSLNISKGSSNNGNVAFYALEVHNGDSKLVNKDGYAFYPYDGVNYLVGYTGTDTDLTLPTNYNGENYVINQFAFAYDTITSVIIPDEVMEIDDRAFLSCPNLTSVIMPNTVTQIPEYMFSGCSKLSNIIMPNTVTSICERAFSECSNLANIIIPNSVKNIFSSAFSGCSNFTNIIIPNSVKNIYDYVFNGCSNLTSVKIGNGITSIGSSPFNKCSKLTDIYIDKPENSISGAPWGATNATVHWNTPLPSEEV